MTIKTAVFRSVLNISTSGSNTRAAVDQSINEVVDEVNTFIAALNPDNVLAIRYAFDEVGNKGYTVYSGLVVYQE